MKTLVFSTKSYDKEYLQKAAASFGIQLDFMEAPLNESTVKITKGYEAVCCFVNDTMNEAVLNEMKANGTEGIALRCAGFNQVDLPVAEKLGIRVCRVPAYSPHSVAEHAVALILTLNRKTHRANNRVREHNFSLEGLMGFDLYQKNVGVIGTGKIGLAFAKIMIGFGCNVFAYDILQNDELKAAGARYVPLEEIYKFCDIISLHCPLVPSTYHLINKNSINLMKNGVMIINTGRGGLVETSSVIHGLKSGKIGYLGLDVYEQEQDIFFRDLSNVIMADDDIARLLTFPNVLITGHQAFFTKNAMESIASTTIENLRCLFEHRECPNGVHSENFYAK